MPLGTAVRSAADGAGGLPMTEAGSMPLAKDDVCYLGDLVKMKKDAVQDLTAGKEIKR